MVLLTLMNACSSPPLDSVQEATDHLFRASVLLRGRPPRPREVEQVGENPSQLESIIRGWGDDETLGALVRDMHAEALYVRFDTQNKPPRVGVLEGLPGGAIAESFDEAPLRLIEHVVVEDRPYTEIVTADYAVVDPVASAILGPVHDPQGPEWQPAPWHDDRPAAGILAHSTFLMRHPTGNLNYHRSRATILASALLCDDITTRAAAGAFDPAMQEEAVATDPQCVACHAVLDPLASSFWGLLPYALPKQIRLAHQTECEGDLAPYCYPLGFWDPAEARGWEALGLPPPASYGHVVADLEALGQSIAEDPRFATCAARRTWSFLARVPLEEVDPALVTHLAEDFVASGFSARDLILDVVTHPRFAPSSADAPAVPIRPQALVRVVESVTGYAWRALPNAEWGPVDLGTTDRFGLQVLMGGIDGWRIVGPEAGALPTRELAMAWLAEEAALHVVAHEIDGSTADPELFVEGLTDKEARARDQLTWWHLRILGHQVDPRGPMVDADWALLHGLLEVHPPRRAWTLMLAAFLQHPRLAVL